MRQLKAYHQICCSSVTLLVCGHKRAANPRKARFVSVIDDKLIRIGPAIRTHGHRLPTVNQLCSTLSKTLPASHDLIGDTARRRSVPAFHWLNRESVTDLFPVDGYNLNRLRQGRSRTGGDPIFAGKFD